jgi:uncharacterized protein (TIGR03435 family)
MSKPPTTANLHQASNPLLRTRSLHRSQYRLFGVRTLLLVLVAFAPAIHAQTFAVASIRPNNTATDGRHHIYNDPANAEFRTVNVSALALLNFAYNTPVTQILNAPAWAKSSMWDVTAKSDPALDDLLSKLPAEESRATKRKMVQALLAERFGLKAHLETRQLPEFALVIAKAGAKLANTNSNGLTINGGRGHLSAAGIPAALLAEQLAQILGQPVIDQTALPGRYDFTLRWTPDDAPPSNAAIESAPSFFTAVEEQLGLKLQARKGAVQVLVIDQLTPPTDN